MVSGVAVSSVKYCTEQARANVELVFSAVKEAFKSVTIHYQK